MPTEKPKSETPFTQPLQNTEFDSEAIKRIENLPGKLVRERPIWADTPEKLQDEIRVFNKGKLLFDKLKDKYGINIPDTGFVIGKNENDEITMFIIVDEIRGKRIDQINLLPEITKEKLDELLASLIQHYFDVYQNGGDFLWKFGMDEIVWGRRKGKEKKSIWFVDVDPEYGTYDKKEPEPKNKRLFTLIARIGEAIIELEKKFEQPVKLQLARQQLKETINNMPSKVPDYQILLNIKNRLAI